MTDASPTVRRDRRIERTHQLLSKALMELIVERGYDSITIQDITDRANVSRTTFYLHFKDKDELLFASMQQIYEGLLTGHEGFMPGSVSEADYDGEVNCDAGDFKHVAEYADFYRVMLGKQGSVTFIVRLLSYLTDAMTETFQSKLRDGEPKIPMSLIAASCAGAEIGVMKWWLDHDMEYSPEEMAKMQFFLSMFGLRWALGRENSPE